MKKTIFSLARFPFDVSSVSYSIVRIEGLSQLIL